MKRRTSILLILLISSVCQAGLFISINGEVSQDPVLVDIDDNVNLSIIATDNEPAMIMALLVIEGPALIDTTQAVVINPSGISHSPLFQDITGWNDAYVRQYGYDPVSILYLEITDVAIAPLSLPDGPLVRDIMMQVVSGGQDTVISLLDDSRAPPAAIDAQILRVPEPATIVLLGLGILGRWWRRA